QDAPAGEEPAVAPETPAQEGEPSEATAGAETATGAAPEHGAAEDAARGERVEGPPSVASEADGADRGGDAGAEARADGGAPPAERQADGARGRDPARVFESLSVEAPYLGGLLLDSRGLVLAGSFRTDEVERGEVLGAVIGAAAEEAARTAALLSIGSWRGILLGTDRALLHVTPVERDLLVLTAAARGTPGGRILPARGRTVNAAR